MANSKWAVTVLVILSHLYFCDAAINLKDKYNETLQITSLHNGLTAAHFIFTVHTNEKSVQSNHYNFFPKALGEILNKYNVEELELSLTQGMWRYQLWGIPQEGMANPSGAHVKAIFKQSSSNVDHLWKNLVNALSGLICASLNFIDEKVTISPQYTFRPQGIVSTDLMFDNSLLRYAAVPYENVCTENLTPFKKLLPCYSKAGLSSLLNAKPLFDSNYHSQTISVRPQCGNEECTKKVLELKQTVSVVTNPQNKRQDWSIRSLFGKNDPMRACPLADASLIFVDVPSSLKMEPLGTDIKVTGGRTSATYKLTDGFTLKASTSKELVYTKHMPPQLFAHRYLGGFGQEFGSITCEVTNSYEEDVKIIYTEYIPWFFRLYLHTLKIQNNRGETIKPAKIHYEPGLERKKPYMLELLLTIPANSTTAIRIEGEKLFLKWTEYPPDANHGFYIPSSIITAVVPDAQPNMCIESMKFGYGVVRMYTEKLLIALPTPDFSMPYNVICLACTVVAIAFGSIHSLTTKEFVREENPEPSLPKKIFFKLKSFFTKETDPIDQATESSTECHSKEAQARANNSENVSQSDDAETESKKVK